MLEASATLSLNYNTVWLIECACNCAVNAFALISGYVGIEKNFKILNIISLWIIVEFYSVGITMVIYFLTSCSVGIKDIIKSVIPVTSGGGVLVLYSLFCHVFSDPFVKRSNTERRSANI